MEIPPYPPSDDDDIECNRCGGCLIERDHARSNCPGPWTIPELLAEVDRLKRDAETAWANEAATSELLREAKADRDRLLVVVARLLEYGEAAMTDEDWAQLRALAGGGK